MHPPPPLPPGAALRRADTDTELRACWPVMQQLRPHLANADDFIARVHRMRADGYRLLAAWQDAQVLALGGYRLQENLVYGRFLYLDDLVTLDSARGQRWGEQMIVAVQAIAERAGCAHFVLDTGVANTGAQRFYARQGLANHAIRYGRRYAQGAAA
ncbi:GNAT family N-acetyltransferase [Pseudorhodoferax sp.]|uniref:GNAT family N-acetyltransferase n=1 Tax=Pseudorhodoferax sp. TaxID=1993553 RepID=UPI002DD65727|nr:GNAT family N-acetyltransferase [Pseudorhodoferax sp.]